MLCSPRVIGKSLWGQLRQHTTGLPRGLADRRAAIPWLLPPGTGLPCRGRWPGERDWLVDRSSPLAPGHTHTLKSITESLMLAGSLYSIPELFFPAGCCCPLNNLLSLVLLFCSFHSHLIVGRLTYVENGHLQRWHITIVSAVHCWRPSSEAT